jgi:tetratricopeptide (TPR) repeat protein
VPVGAAALVIASLTTGLFIANQQRYMANRQREIAERRFAQVRQLANKVLALDDILDLLPGSTKAREEIVAMSQAYLEGLLPDARADEDLSVELAQAYSILAGAQGVPTRANLGHLGQAEESLQKANALLEPVLRRSPRNRKALLLSARVAHDRMIVASTGHHRDEALAEGRKAVSRVDTMLSLGPTSPSEMLDAAQIFNNVALAHKNQHRYNDAVRYARRGFEAASSLPGADQYSANALSIVADSLRFSGDLEGALQAIQEAHRRIDRATFAGETERRANIFNVLWREGVILGQDGSISLDRPVEAAQVLQEALDLTEEWAQKDRDNVSSRIRLVTAARELGRILQNSDPRRALAVYEKALLRISEVNTPEGRREEARLLAYSSYVLRRVHRGVEAKDRIDAAFRLLRQTKDYPADRINPDYEAYAVLCALGDHLVETDQPKRAAEVYQEILDKVSAYEPDPENDLRDAIKLSRIYQTLAALDRRIGRSSDASALDARRAGVWRYWKTKLPNNAFVQRQLAEKAAP